MIDNALSLDEQIVQAKRSELEQFERMKGATQERRRIEERAGLTYEQMARAPWIENEDLNSDELWDRGVSAIRRAYWLSVKLLVEEIVERFKLGETFDIHEAVQEDVDGSQWVIYTSRAMQVLWVSEHDEAGFESGVIEMDSDSIPWSQLAYCAMEADLWDEFGRLQVDFDPQNPTFCPECDEEWSEHRLDSDNDVYICPEEDEDEEESDDDDPA